MILWIIWTCLEIYLGFSFVKYILYQYTDFPSHLPLIKMHLNEMWNYSLKPWLFDCYHYIHELWRNFNLQGIYDKLYSFACFIFMPICNSYVYKSCKTLYNKYASPYLPAESLPKYLIISLLACFLIYKLCGGGKKQRGRSRTQTRELHTPEERQYTADSEPLSDEEIDSDVAENHTTSSNNVVDDGDVDISSYRNASHRNCSICKHYEFNAVVLPCGHTALCLKCALKYYYYDKKCPVCSKAIWTIHRIYL